MSGEEEFLPAFQLLNNKMKLSSPSLFHLNQSGTLLTAPQWQPCALGPEVYDHALIVAIFAFLPASLESGCSL